MTVVFLGTVASCLALIARLGASVARRDWVRAKRSTAYLVSIVLLYSSALFFAGWALPVKRLELGQAKCFDDWCLALMSYERGPDGFVLRFEAQNRGRRTQRPDSPYIEVVGEREAAVIGVDGLGLALAGGTTRTLTTMVPWISGPVAVIPYEGSFPAMLVIGDDSWPFRSKDYWEVDAP